MANTETKVDLVINRMSQSKYEQLKSAGQLNPNQIYMTTDGTDPVPETRKVNGKTLEADVTLTGADIAVSTSDSTKINTALAGKAASNHTHSNYVPTSRTVNGKSLDADVTLTGADIEVGSMSLDAALSLKQNALSTQQLQNIAAVPNKLDNGSEVWNVSYTDDGLHIADTAGVYYIDVAPGCVKTNYPDVHNVYWPENQGTLALLQDLAGDFSSSTAYAKDALVVYQGALYRCKNQNGHTGAWVDADFTTATVQNILSALRTGKADTNHTHSNYVPTSRTIAGQDLTANITAATLATAIGLDSYKPLQTAKTDPTASGNATSFIDTITQNANGVITATKKTIPSASTSQAGIVQLNDNMMSGSTTQAATPNAVNSVYLACLRNSLDDQTLSANVFTQKSSISQDTSEETFIHRINFTDSTNRRIGDISTRKTAAGNYLTGFACRAPVGTDGAEVVSYVNAIVGSDGTSYITIPTPDLSSDSNIAATTEWVRDNCIVTSGMETQVIKGTKILRMWSPLDWEAAVTGETLYNMIEFRDNAFDYIGAIKIVKYSSGNTKMAFECKNPTSTKVSYMQLVTLPDGTDHVTLPTPPYNSNSNIAATTEWVRNALNTRIPRSTVSATTLQLKNQTCNTISISTAGTYVFIPPEKISSVSRHYYLYLMNNTTSDITVKFSRTNPGESTASVAYYSNMTFTPTTTLAGKSGYVYEFLEFSPDAIKVTQEQMYRRTSLEV